MSPMDDELEALELALKDSGGTAWDDGHNADPLLDIRRAINYVELAEERWRHGD